MKVIRYENFRTEVTPPIPVPAGENGQTVEMIVLRLIDKDCDEIHEFTYPKDAAAKVGRALGGSGLVKATADVLDDLRRDR